MSKKDKQAGEGHNLKSIRQECTEAWIHEELKIRAARSIQKEVLQRAKDGGSYKQSIATAAREILMEQEKLDSKRAVQAETDAIFKDCLELPLFKDMKRAA